MVEVLQLELLIIMALVVLSFISGHLLRKFNIIVIPESVVAVLLGMIFGVIWFFLPGLSEGLKFNNEAFFLVLLPFIIFESGFSVHRQSLFRNIGSILTFAIIGTFLSALGIGAFVYATAQAQSLPLTLLDCMIIGAIMSSTDPVATLSIVRKYNF